MSFKQTHEIGGRLGECLRELIHALGHCDFEVTGNQVIVRDHGRRVVMDLVYEGDRHLGSLDLPMTRVDYEFVGYTKEETDAFMAHLKQHMARIGGG